MSEKLNHKNLRAWPTKAFYTGVVALSLIFVLLLSACAGIAPTGTPAPTKGAGDPTPTTAGREATATPGSTATTAPTATSSPNATSSPTATTAPKATTAPTPTSSGLRTFTKTELAAFNGKSGNAAYIAISGTVYDVSAVSVWSTGTHEGFAAGKDLTADFPHSASKFSGVPIVGTYVG